LFNFLTTTTPYEKPSEKNIQIVEKWIKPTITTDLPKTFVTKEIRKHETIHVNL